MGKSFLVFFVSLVMSGCHFNGYKQPLVKPVFVPGECAFAEGGWSRDVGIFTPFSSANDHARANQRMMVGAGVYQYLCESSKAQRARWSRPYGWNAAAEKRYQRGLDGPVLARLESAEKKVAGVDKAQDAFLNKLVEGGKAESAAPAAATTADQAETKATVQATPLTRAQKIEAAQSIAEIVAIYEQEAVGKATADFIRKKYLPLAADKQAKLLPILKAQLTAKRGYMP